MESMYEYGARAGFWRLHRMLKDLPITVYGVATALARAPEQVAAMKSAGWEIASHGLKWIEYKDASPEDEAADMAEAIRLHSEVVGTAAARLVHGTLLGTYRSLGRRDRAICLCGRQLCR
jgi:peptidoglycan/xylan/chitin deacetylase (PgdA/CDA1 family)